MEKRFIGPQLSKSDCQKAVANKLKTSSFRIKEYQQIAFDEINGYLGEHCTLKVTIERNSCEEVFSFFVKFPPLVPTQRQFLEDINGIVKEVNFFTKYVPLLTKHGIDVLDGAIPKCFHLSGETCIFEDLKTQGYECFSPRVPLSLDYVKAGLISLAKLHASGLILEEVKKYRLPEEFGVELQEGFYFEKTDNATGSCKTAIKALIDISHEDTMKISKDLFKQKASLGIESIKEFVKPTARFRNTVCHADAWSKNFMFRKSDDAIDCVVVDFQTYRYGAPAHDVLSFIHMVSDRVLRKHNLRNLLEFYYNNLSQNFHRYGFGNVVTEKEFFESVDYYQELVLLDTLNHFQVVILSDELAVELFQNPEKAQSLFNDRSEFFKMACERDDVFKKRNFEAIADLRDLYEKQLAIINRF